MRSLRFFLVVLVLLVPLVALAQQPTTGSIIGTVVDNENKPLPGATVTISGALGDKATQTDAEGNFEFRFLPPANYKMRIEMAGFAPIQYNKVPVTTGQRTRVPVKMLAGKTEEITVTSATPLIDVKKAEVTTNFRTDQTIQTMPIGRNFVAAIAFAPGVVSGGGTGGGNYSISGASGLENSYLIDGVNIGDQGYGGVGTYSIAYGSLGTGITSDFLEEVQVKTAGFEAEYGQALGGVISGTVRSGTNEFKGRVGVYYEPASMNATPKEVVLTNGATNIYDRESLDIGLQAGGPILKDRFFWFAAYNPVKTKNKAYVAGPSADNYVAVNDPTTATTYSSDIYLPGIGKENSIEGERQRDNYAAKLSGLLTPNHRLELTAFGDPSDGYGSRGQTASSNFMLADSTSFVREGLGFGNGGLASTIEYGADQQSLKYNGLFGSDFFVEAQVSHRNNEFKEISTVNDYSFRDRRIVLLTGVSQNPRVGGVGFIGPSTDKSWDYALKLSKTFGNHEVKIGGQYFDLKYSNIAKYSGPTINVPFAEAAFDEETETWVPTGNSIIVPTTSGATVDIRGGYGAGNCDPTNPIYGGLNCAASPVYRVTRGRFNDPGETTAKEYSFFAQDTWAINDNWTVKLGVRTTSQELAGAGSFEIPISGVGGGYYTLDPHTVSPNSYKFDMELSPRVGIIWDPAGDGRTKVYGNYARYFQRVPSDLAVRQFSNEFGVSQFQFSDPDLTTRSGATGSPRLQGLSPTRVEDGTKLPYQDEYVVGVQRLLRSDLSVEVRGVFRKQGRALEDVQFSVLEAVQNYYYGDGNTHVDLDIDGDGTETTYTLPDPFPGYGYAPFGEYVLANPGDNTEGPFVKAKREYKALEIQMEKRLLNNWQAFANYRYSRLRGNYEGLFRNDNGQSDPNITSLFDFPNSPLMRGQFNAGALNNDRPHVLNVGGTYFWDNGFEAGALLTWQSGTPRTPLLAHPNYQNAGEIPGRDPVYYYVDPADPNFDAEGNLQWNLSSNCTDRSYGCFLAGYTDAPRGSLGRVPDYATMDLHLGWGRNIGDTRLKINVDVNNIFNNQEVQTYNDFVELTAATPDPEYLKITGYQLPRSVRLSVIWDF